MFAGFATIALGYFVFGSFVDMVHEFHFLGIVFALLVAMMYIASLQWPRELSAEQREAAATPAPIPMERWKPAVPVGVTLAIVVVAIYLYFAFV